MTAATETVREIAQTRPTSIRVFEKFGIEYCCGGHRPRAVKDIDVNTVFAALEAAAGSENAGAKDWTKESLANLTKHIMGIASRLLQGRASAPVRPGRSS